mmetsp:Transcript_46723/g.83667  ORF Transcript_46723/g.83667 Transcript_46723/m.83667 type:complete len:208 (+) Transcript_46723:867-1490(+)
MLCIRQRILLGLLGRQLLQGLLPVPLLLCKLLFVGLQKLNVLILDPLLLQIAGFFNPLVVGKELLPFHLRLLLPPLLLLFLLCKLFMQAANLLGLLLPSPFLLLKLLLQRSFTLVLEILLDVGDLILPPPGRGLRLRLPDLPLIGLLQCQDFGALLLQSLLLLLSHHLGVQKFLLFVSQLDFALLLCFEQLLVLLKVLVHLFHPWLL